MDKISQTINESCFSCQNIGKISISVILVVFKCSKYDVKNPFSPIFRGPQTPHIATIFENISQTILFYIYESARHIFVTICNTFRFSTARHRAFLMVFLRLINCALFGKSHFSTIKCVTLDYYCLVEQWRQAIVIFMLPK